MSAQLFYAHGEFCATHPWEIIMATLTLTACLLTVEKPQPGLPIKPQLRDCNGCLYEAGYNADVIVMTLIRCLAILYGYYQFRNLRKMGSNVILGIAGLFVVFSSFVLTSTVINFLHIDLSDLKDTLIVFLLVIDLSKAGRLAQFALSGSNEEVKENIGRGMALLGPAITLDTIVETLVIGVGTLSGVHRLEVLSYIVWLSVLVNYAIFMTFYPACLSLIMELSRNKHNMKHYITSPCPEDDQKSNPVVQRVKLIMSFGLIFVHLSSRWSVDANDVSMIDNFGMEQRDNLNNTGEDFVQENILRWIALSTDHVIILMLFLALVAKFVLFENKQEVRAQLYQSNPPSIVAEPINYVQPVSRSFTTSNTGSKRMFSLAEEDDDSEDDIINIKIYEEKAVQTSETSSDYIREFTTRAEPRTLGECVEIYNSDLGASKLTDEEVIMLVENKHIPAYQIEKAVEDPERGVKIRRSVVGVSGNFIDALANLPYENYDYSKVMGACCENVIGYIPIPVGVVGPMKLDGKLIYVPVATTEGCLVASTNRGTRALLTHGITSRVVADGMTRGPLVRFPSVSEASAAMAWMEKPENFVLIKEAFDSSSRFARLSNIRVRIVSRLLFIRFVAKTGDAMGMNMLSKGTEQSLKMIQTRYPNMEILSLSGNVCTDKKPAAINWIEGRGKSVVCEAVVPASVVKSVLKTTVGAIVEVNMYKNLVGSAVAGSIGGFNAHAANLVTGVFIATGQDPAQNVDSSNCMTLMEPWGDRGEDLYISCSMPSIEIGTVGGGTVLPPQGACLNILGVKGPHRESPGENANQLARVVCATVLAGELSLMAALTAGHLVKSHLKHNRSSVAMSDGFCGSSATSS